MKNLRKMRDNETTKIDPEEMVIRAFSRCSNYPKERAGVLGLAQGLARASEKTGIEMQRIVDDCVSASTFCPTDYDLMEVAKSIKGQSEFTMGPKPTEQCRKCNDWGSYNDDKGEPCWCDCCAAEQLREDHPGWLELAGRLRRKQQFLGALHGSGITMEKLNR